MKRRSKLAFTLIELLVAILFPIFDQAKAAAKKTQCYNSDRITMCRFDGL